MKKKKKTHNGKVSIITWIQLRAFWAGNLISFQPPLSTVQPNECHSESGQDKARGLQVFHYSLVLTFYRLASGGPQWHTCRTVHKLNQSLAPITTTHHHHPPPPTTTHSTHPVHSHHWTCGVRFKNVDKKRWVFFFNYYYYFDQKSVHFKIFTQWFFYCQIKTSLIRCFIKIFTTKFTLKNRPTSIWTVFQSLISTVIIFFFSF